MICGRGRHGEHTQTEWDVPYVVEFRVSRNQPQRRHTGFKRVYVLIRSNDCDIIFGYASSVFLIWTIVNLKYFQRKWNYFGLFNQKTANSPSDYNCKDHHQAVYCIVYQKVLPVLLIVLFLWLMVRVREHLGSYSRHLIITTYHGT